MLVEGDVDLEGRVAKVTFGLNGRRVQRVEQVLDEFGHLRDRFDREITIDFFTTTVCRFVCCLLLLKNLP